jgi:hypothetical protein
VSARVPEVWFAIPSANPELCRSTLPAWRDMGYKVAVGQNHRRGEIPADLTVWWDEYPGWAASINRLCATLVPPTAAAVVSGGDDMLPDPRVRASDIAGQFIDHFGGTFGVMQPHGDTFLNARHYCGSPWLGRAFIERAYGGRGPMFPGYRHNWADNELYWVARCLGLLWERTDLSQHHQHFTRTGAPKPEYWTVVEKSDQADLQLFLARAWQGFPGCEPLAAPGEEPRSFDTAAFAAAYPRTAERFWVSRYARDLSGGEPERRVREALMECARRGERRVALFGAGTHTREAGGALTTPPAAVEVVAIIDDHPDLRGTRLWNYPVVSCAQASKLALDAVVLSSANAEEALATAAAGLVSGGARLVRLYGEAGATEPAAAAGR